MKINVLVSVTILKTKNVNRFGLVYTKFRECQELLLILVTVSYDDGFECVIFNSSLYIFCNNSTFAFNSAFSFSRFLIRSSGSEDTNIGIKFAGFILLYDILKKGKRQEILDLGFTKRI